MRFRGGGSPLPAPHVVVLGLMASGKTTFAQLLAARLARPLRDNDEELRQLTGRSAAELAAERGLDELHELEAEVLRRSLAGGEPAVVTAAASLGDRADLDGLLAGQLVVWLDVDPLVLAQRIADGADHRPLLAEAVTQLRAQRQRRAPAFRAAADLVLPWSGEPPEQLVDRVLARLGPALER